MRFKGALMQFLRQRAGYQAERILNRR